MAVLPILLHHFSQLCDHCVCVCFFPCPEETKPHILCVDFSSNARLQSASMFGVCVCFMDNFRCCLHCLIK